MELGTSINIRQISCNLSVPLTVSKRSFDLTKCTEFHSFGQTYHFRAHKSNVVDIHSCHLWLHLYHRRYIKNHLRKMGRGIWGFIFVLNRSSNHPLNRLNSGKRKKIQLYIWFITNAGRRHNFPVCYCLRLCLCSGWSNQLNIRTLFQNWLITR